MKTPKSVRELIEQLVSGGAAEYLFFWGHQPAPGGAITKSCFSQWWKAPFTVDGIEYRTAEHFMMAAKARLFGDTATLELVLAAKHPKDAKALAQ